MELMISPWILQCAPPVHLSVYLSIDLDRYFFKIAKEACSNMPLFAARRTPEMRKSQVASGTLHQYYGCGIPHS